MKVLKLVAVPVLTPLGIAESSDGEEIEACWAAVGAEAMRYPAQAAYVVAANLFTRLAAEMGVEPDAVGAWARDLTRAHLKSVQADGHAFVIGIPRPRGPKN